MSRQVDYVVVGGGFYGCCLALFLRTVSPRVMLVEAGDTLLDRASRVNQARVHTGFHYPRSALTAVRSMILHQRFISDFPDAISHDFQMLYAIARRGSKVSSKRFFRMFRDIGAPIEPASPGQEALFNNDMIEGVFRCSEAAFDYMVLRRLLTERLDRFGVDVRTSTELLQLDDGPHGVRAFLSDGSEVIARYAFNVTYSSINETIRRACLPTASLKHELAEIALIEPPPMLRATGVTVMDGPFFSCMPYPAEGLHSLTHVRYTPHESWVDESGGHAPLSTKPATNPESRAVFMIHDAQRFLPSLKVARLHHSIYEVKTLLTKTEANDGRPILYQQKPAGSHLVSILGSKIDNVYDLFELVKRTSPEFSGAHSRLIANGSP